MAAWILPKKVYYAYALDHTSMISDLQGVSITTAAQQMYGASEAPSSLGNSFLSHNYPAAILSIAVLLSFEMGKKRKKKRAGSSILCANSIRDNEIQLQKEKVTDWQTKPAGRVENQILRCTWWKTKMVGRKSWSWWGLKGGVNSLWHPLGKKAKWCFIFCLN